MQLSPPDLGGFWGIKVAEPRRSTPPAPTCSQNHPTLRRRRLKRSHCGFRFHALPPMLRCRERPTPMSKRSKRTSPPLSELRMSRTCGPVEPILRGSAMVVSATSTATEAEPREAEPQPSITAETVSLSPAKANRNIGAARHFTPGHGDLFDQAAEVSGSREGLLRSQLRRPARSLASGKRHGQSRSRGGFGPATDAIAANTGRDRVQMAGQGMQLRKPPIAVLSYPERRPQAQFAVALQGLITLGKARSNLHGLKVGAQTMIVRSRQTVVGHFECGSP
jgi:hypothetical protein